MPVDTILFCIGLDDAPESGFHSISHEEIARKSWIAILLRHVISLSISDLSGQPIRYISTSVWPSALRKALGSFRHGSSQLRKGAGKMPAQQALGCFAGIALWLF
jgi:hypothetical protein